MLSCCSSSIKPLALIRNGIFGVNTTDNGAVVLISFCCRVPFGYIRIMFDITIKAQLEQFRREFSQLTDDQFGRAVSKAINRQLTPSKRLAIKDICKIYNIPEDYLNERTTIALKHSGPKSLTAQILVNTKAISLNAFDPVETATGVELEIKRGEKTTIAGAFMGIMPNGGYGVFGRGSYKGNKFAWRDKRVRPGGKSEKVNGVRRPENNDLAVNNLKSVSAYTSFVKPAVLEALSKRLNEQLPKRLALELTKASGAGID